MKKKLAALTLGLALALSLVSCGGGSAEALISAMEVMCTPCQGHISKAEQFLLRVMNHP